MNSPERRRNAGREPELAYLEEGVAAMELARVRGGTHGKGRAPEGSSLPPRSRLTDNAFAFQRTAALRAAVGLGVFTAIGEGHKTPQALARRCVAAERGVRVLCDFLVAIGLLDRTGEGYVAAPDAAAYLDRRSLAFIGDALDFVASGTILRAVLSDPAAVVRNGGTILGEANHFVAPDQTDWTTYARTVAPMMARSAASLAALVANRGAEIHHVLDIAAGPGQNGIALAKHLPDVRVTAVDWPGVLEVAARNARAAGLDGRWKAQPGSALDTEFAGSYDVALVVRFLHLLAPQQREALLRRVHAALAPGGRIVALQIMLNDDHVSPPFAAAMNFSVLATTPSGEVLTTGELEASLRAVGFDRLEWHDLRGSDERIVIGWK
jgi:SAM-dependent methyltransferase